uniref:Solute carrier family 46 member 3 n=1 Tax=Cacopsylla melanoneura TaxID=428564 RepID=A0A8D9BUR0_9HEMI
MITQDDNDDQEHLIKTSREERSNSHLADGAVNSIERCPSENQLDTRVLSPSENPKNHYFTVEPIFFLIFAAGTISDPVVVNLLLSKVCMATNATNDCDNPSPAVELQIQPIVADIQMFRTLLECAFPAFLSFFLGPWSDVNGRKPIILCSTFGIFISNLTWVLVSYIPDLPPIAVLVCSIPIALSGGLVTLYLGSFCYISDVTSIESRALRMGLLQVANFAGLVLGNLASAPLLKRVGYHGVFQVSTGLTFLALVYAALVLRETIHVSNDENRKKNVFDCELVADMLATCCKRRPYYTRASIFLIMMSVCLFLVSLNGEGSVMYLGVRERFMWTMEDFTMFNCYSIGMIGVGTFFGLWVSTMIKVPDMLSALLVLIIKMPTLIICAMTTQGHYFYVAATINMFGCCLGPLVRSYLSKIIPKEDLGKVFALTASAESLTPLAASPLYTYVYNSTITFLPGCVYYLSSVLNLVTTVLVSIVLMFHFRNPSSLQTLTSSVNS